MTGQVYLLTNNWEFHALISVKNAIKLMFRDKCVEVIKYSDIELSNGFVLPKVLRLLKSVRKYYGRKVNWSKSNCFVRDSFKCQFCDIKLNHDEATIDHVLPQSRGGKTDFDNCVTACKNCNSKKDNRTPSEAKMFLKRQPYTPTIMEFFRRKCKLMGIEKVLQDMGIY